jgi:uncharacterized membrane protein YdbT with pleckstrin-like domain
MGYVDQNLMPGEQVIHRVQFHWVMFLRPAIIGLLGLLFLGSANIRGEGFVFLLIAILSGIGTAITYTSSEFAVTNKRVIVKVGLIRRISLELLLSKVESIGVNQSILGRMLGYGSIEVRGTGSTKERIPNISDPMTFRRKVQEQIPTS